MPPGQPFFTGAEEIKIRAGLSHIPGPEIVVNNHPGLCQIPDHGHVSPLALIGPRR